MAEFFEVAELVKVGVEDEKTGLAFYSALAERSPHPGFRALWKRLAAEEKVHQARFEKMLAALGGVKSSEQYPGEYLAYLRALTGERAFPDEAAAVRMARECPDDLTAVELAGRFERDTLILMGEMRRLVPPRARQVVDEIIREEQGHLATLAEARRLPPR